MNGLLRVKPYYGIRIMDLVRPRFKFFREMPVNPATAQAYR
jgi:hypothetical protein